MVGRPDYRSPLAAFRTPDAPKLVIKTLHKFTLAVTEIQGAGNHGATASLPYDEAYLIQLRLLECPRCDYFSEGRHLSAVDRRAGLTMIHDLRRDPVVDLQDPFHVLHLYLPRKVIDGIADEAGAQPIRDLRVAPSDTFEDAVVRDLLSSLRPALANPTEASTLFVDHVVHALCVHVAQVYGQMPTSPPLRGGLAPWQERRAKELLNENLDGEICLSQLAVECGLSVRHFTRAFRRSIGVPPHRYLLKNRVERAQQLLKDPTLSLLDVALACGFSDQSHFTRVFSASTSVSPGVWRRMRMSKTTS